jgi:hypothetical protein
MLHPAAVVIHRMPFDVHNSAAVAELEHAVCGMDMAADHATPSPLFAEKCSDEPIA